jgi:hypothetical protein
VPKPTEFVHPAVFDARRYSAEVVRLHRKDPTPTGTCVVCPGHRWPCAAARLAFAVNQLLEAP